MTSKPRTISARVTIEEKEILNNLVKESNLNQTDLFKKIIELYAANGLGGIGLTGDKVAPQSEGMTPDQRAKIIKAVKIAGSDFDSFMIDSSIEKADKIIKLSETPLDELKKTPNGAALRIHSFVLETMTANKKATVDTDKIGITQGIMTQTLKNNGRLGVNRQAAIDYIEDNKELIFKHHKEVGILSENVKITDIDKIKSELQQFNVRARTPRKS